MLTNDFEQVLYAAEMRQIKVIKLFSTRARQTIRYHCMNSHAWEKKHGKIAHKTVKFLTDNEHEVHGHSFDAEMKPRILKDGCMVSLLSNHISYLRHLTDLQSWPEI